MDKNKIKKKRLIINIIGIILFIALGIVIVVLLAPQFKEFMKDPNLFKQYIKDHGIYGSLIFVAIQILQVIVSIIPGEFVEIGAGITFGWWWGLVLCELGMFIATTFIYFFSKKVGKPTVQALIGDKQFGKLEKLDSNPKRDKVLFLIYLCPGLPKDLLTYIVPFFNISFWKFMFINLVGRIPSIVTSTIAGHYIIQGDYLEAFLIFVITGVLAILSYLLNDKLVKLVTKHKEKKKEEKEIENANAKCIEEFKNQENNINNEDLQ